MRDSVIFSYGDIAELELSEITNFLSYNQYEEDDVTKTRHEFTLELSEITNLLFIINMKRMM